MEEEGRMWPDVEDHVLVNRWVRMASCLWIDYHEVSDLAFGLGETRQALMCRLFILGCGWGDPVSSNGRQVVPRRRWRVRLSPRRSLAQSQPKQTPLAPIWETLSNHHCQFTGHSITGHYLSADLVPEAPKCQNHTSGQMEKLNNASNG